MPNGSPLNIQVPLSTTSEKMQASSDHIMNYGLRILELGLAFKTLQSNVKIPNRDRFMQLMKYLMCILKGHNNNSKYALEILRFIVHQQCTMDEKTAHQSFYGLFVNNKGDFDSSIPADLQMEHIVRLIKGHLKAVHSNKKDTAIAKRTAAFAGMKNISASFDDTSRVIIRSQKHRIVSSHSDECMIINDLQKLKPFDHKDGRKLPSFPKPVQSPLSHLNMQKLKSWIREHQYNLHQEEGN